MDFKTGNSGNLLRHAVVKTGPGCRQEGAFCQYLGTSIAPDVYALIEDGYIMEVLAPAPRSRTLLCEIEIALEYHVWRRDPLPITTDKTWQDALSFYGITVPKGIGESCPALVHGDPTVSNALWRHNLIMADPRPPRDFVPQCIETDMGRILQSYHHWEYAAYGEDKIDYMRPLFLQNPQLKRAAEFWCGAAAARIQYLERSRSAPRQRILDWCNYIRKLYNV